MSATQQIITVDDISADNAPAIYVTGGLGRFIDAVKAEVESEVPDTSTRKGRERIASLAASVSKSKTAVEKPGREYLKRLKEMPKAVEAELRDFVDQMDALRDKTRAPLTEWQAAEDARIDEHEAGLASLRNTNTEGATAAMILALIEDLAQEEIGSDWEEFEAEAHRIKASSLSALHAALALREKYEAEQAELIRLRAEAEAQAQHDRDAEIARAAVEKANREAAETAQAERDAAARREQALIDQAAQARREAEQKARDAEAAAERQALQLQLQAEQAATAAAQAEANRLAAEQRAEQERKDAIDRQAQAVERARLAEIARANAAADEIIRQQDLREADKAHKGSIYKAAKEAFIANGMTEECARLAVKLIASGLIPAFSIQY